MTVPLPQAGLPAWHESPRSLGRPGRFWGAAQPWVSGTPRILALADPDAAVVRVADRVRRGGHDIPPEVVRRRYAAGLRDFHDLYRPLASSWQLFDNGREDGPLLIAQQFQGGSIVILDPVVWSGLEAKR